MLTALTVVSFCIQNIFMNYLLSFQLQESLPLASNIYNEKFLYSHFVSQRSLRHFEKRPIQVSYEVNQAQRVTRKKRLKTGSC